MVVDPIKVGLADTIASNELPTMQADSTSPQAEQRIPPVG